MKSSPNQITAHNAGWRIQFRWRGSRHRPGVAALFRSAFPRVFSIRFSNEDVLDSHLEQPRQLEGQR